jgi:hypothetical protein
MASVAQAEQDPSWPRSSMRSAPERSSLRMRNSGSALRPQRLILDTAADALGQVGGHHLDPFQPLLILTLGPATQVGCAVSLHHVDHHPPVEIDQAVA